MEDTQQEDSARPCSTLENDLASNLKEKTVEYGRV